MRALRKYQAPMLLGSSWTHTRGVPSRNAARASGERVAQRVVLLEAHDGDVVALAAAPLGRQVVVDLAAAEDDALDLRALDRLVADDALERALGDLVERIDRLGVPEQRLRREDDERLAPGAVDLPAQHVKELRGRRQVADLDVVLRGQLQEALDARARVLRALPLEAVRQEQDEAGEARPLVFRRDDELVDDDLRGVGEVAELRLPDDELVGSVEGVAVLEAEDARLAEGRVVDLEAADAAVRRVPEMGERRVRLAGLGVEEDRVPVREGAAPRVLPADADAVALEEDRRERQVLGGAPVERRGPAIGALAALLEDLEHLGVGVEPGGHRGQLVERVEQLAPSGSRSTPPGRRRRGRPR